MVVLEDFIHTDIIEPFNQDQSSMGKKLYFETEIMYRDCIDLFLNCGTVDMLWNFWLQCTLSLQLNHTVNQQKGTFLLFNLLPSPSLLAWIKDSDEKRTTTQGAQLEEWQGLYKGMSCVTNYVSWAKIHWYCLNIVRTNTGIPILVYILSVGEDYRNCAISIYSPSQNSWNISNLYHQNIKNIYCPLPKKYVKSQYSLWSLTACLGGGKKKCVTSFSDAKTIGYTLPHFTQRKVTRMLHIPKLIYQDCRKVWFGLSGPRLHQPNAQITLF